MAGQAALLRSRRSNNRSVRRDAPDFL